MLFHEHKPCSRDTNVEDIVTNLGEDDPSATNEVVGHTQMSHALVHVAPSLLIPFSQVGNEIVPFDSQFTLGSFMPATILEEDANTPPLPQRNLQAALELVAASQDVEAHIPSPVSSQPTTQGHAICIPNVNTEVTRSAKKAKPRHSKTDHVLALLSEDLR